MTTKILRWTLAFVLASGAITTLAGLHAGDAPTLVLGGLAAVEAIAAALFLVPAMLRPAGWMLLAVLAAAAGLHVAAGQVPPPSFVVYAAAIGVVMREARR